MKKKYIRRSNLIIRIAFVFIFVFLFISVINLQVEIRSLRTERDKRVEKVQKIQDSIDELELRIATPIDDDFIERIARDKLGYRKQGETIFYNDIAN
ncbi:MAG: septum formation initiator family protein [Clostridia bacterium]|nr:septum formation initiator family protein [Clostridia bacterium]